MIRLTPSLIRHASIATATVSAVALVFVVVIAVLRVDLPDVEGSPESVRYDEAATLLDRHGAPLAAVGGQTRLTLPLDRLPELLKRAWLQVEDRRFYDHGGIDIRGVMRASWVNVRSGGVMEGASSIPMQVARLVWADSVADLNRWERKLFEASMAPRLVDALGHDRVLELYLNGLYLGDGVYGVGAAARHYYGAEVDELTVDQIATLVGLGKTPERYNPRTQPERAKTRRDLVLREMLAAGLISEEERAEAEKAPVETLDSPPLSYRRSYMSMAVRRELRSVAPELVGRPGLRIRTTIDPRAQTMVDSVVPRHLQAIADGEYGRPASPDQPVQGGLIVIDSRTGEIRALSGGRDFGESPLNRAIQTQRQVGSLAKPLLYATALERGLSAARPLSTAAIELETDEGPWRPADHVEEQMMLPSEVIVRSSNRGAVRMGQEVGAAGFVSALETFGVGRDARPYPSTFLGSFEASLSDVTAAFAAFENGGFRVAPHLIQSVEDERGTVLWERPALPAPRILSEQTAFLVMDALKGVVDRGTGQGVRATLPYGRAAAGKTGTSNEGRDAWFVGMTPGLAIGVWVGHDQPAPITHGGSGSRLAVPLWATAAAALSARGEKPTPVEGMEPQGGWDPPRGVHQVLADDAGRVYAWDCRAVVSGTTRSVWVQRESLLSNLSSCSRAHPVMTMPRARLNPKLAPLAPTLRPTAGREGG
ncbi:transglycosylase domain-containing protein [Gaopeijia maritima]|uniref:transglycosylase domain-containing protein n=1 Tax=Gaopeijia maritima TaxID=3119007 RepID=UPI00328D3347